jgi:hypothetical protein
MLFHEWVAQELVKLKEEDVIDPPYKLDPKKDHLLGEMGEGLKKLFTLYAKSSEELMQVQMVDISKVLSGYPASGKRTDREAYLKEAQKKSEEMKAKMKLLKERYDLLKQIFWFSLKDEFPASAGKSTVAVCQGFKVAWSESDEDSGMPIIVIPIRI